MKQPLSDNIDTNRLILPRYTLFCEKNRIWFYLLDRNYDIIVIKKSKKGVYIWPLQNLTKS